MRGSRLVAFMVGKVERATCDYSKFAATCRFPKWFVWATIVGFAILFPLIVNFSTSTVPFIFCFPIEVLLWYVLQARLVAALPRWAEWLFPKEDNQARSVSAKSGWRFPLAVGTAYLLVVAVCGFGLVTDTGNQWNQVQTGKWNDWHPILHTAMFYLASRICNKPIMIWIMQTAMFVLLYRWMNTTLMRMNLRSAARKLLCCVVALSPVTLLASRQVDKDIAFAQATIGVVLALCNIGISGGAWLKPLRNKFLLASLFLGASFFRHNGFFVTLPIAVLLYTLIWDRKSRLHAACAFVLVAVACFGYLGLRSFLFERQIVNNNQSQRYLEAIGLPIAIIGETYTANPCLLSDESREFCEHIAPLDVWRMHFRGFGNGIKRRLNMKYLAENVPPKDFLKSLAKIVREDPKHSLKATVRVTGIGWNPVRERVPGKRISGVDATMRSYDLVALNNLVVHPPLGWALATPGFAFCCMLLVGWICMMKSGLSSFVPSIGLLAYLFGTSLLMYDDGSSDYRFFYAVQLSYPFALLWSIRSLVFCGGARKVG